MAISLVRDAAQIILRASGEAPITIGTTGEVNTATNLGDTGEGIYAGKSGVTLQLKKLVAGSNITLTSSADSIEIAASGGGGSGIVSYATEAALLADTTQTAGTIAYAEDTLRHWSLAQAPDAWAPLNLNRYSSEADIFASGAPAGTIAYSLSEQTLWVRFPFEGWTRLPRALSNDDPTEISVNNFTSAGESEIAAREDHVHNVPAVETSAGAADAGKLAVLDANGQWDPSLVGPERIYVATTNLGAAQIVGTSAGTLGHASGVEVVAAVLGKRISVVECAVHYTFDTAAYTAGGTVSLRYSAAPAAIISTTQAAATSFGSAASRSFGFAPAGYQGAVTTHVGSAVSLTSGAAYTQPGTAAGTAVVTTYYRLLDA
jgi:hypothetical protein